MQCHKWSIVTADLSSMTQTKMTNLSSAMFLFCFFTFVFWPLANVCSGRKNTYHPSRFNVIILFHQRVSLFLNLVLFSGFSAGMSSNTSALLLLTIDDIQSGIILALNLKSLNQQICDVSSVQRWIGMRGRGHYIFYAQIRWWELQSWDRRSAVEGVGRGVIHLRNITYDFTRTYGGEAAPTVPKITFWMWSIEGNEPNKGPEPMAFEDSPPFKGAVLRFMQLAINAWNFGKMHLYECKMWKQVNQNECAAFSIWPVAFQQPSYFL